MEDEKRAKKIMETDSKEMFLFWLAIFTIKDK